MPHLITQSGTYYLLYPHGEQVGPFATLAEVERWLEWVDSRNKD